MIRWVEPVEWKETPLDELRGLLARELLRVPRDEVLAVAAVLVDREAVRKARDEVVARE